MFDMQLAKKAPKGLEEYAAPKFVMEPKLDGMRVGVTVKDGNVSIYSRTHKSQAGKLPHLEAAFAGADLDFEIDGEVVALTSLVDTPQGSAPLADFNKTMRVMGSNPDEAVAKQKNAPLVFLAFDVVSVYGVSDERVRPEAQRRELLEDVINQIDSPYVAVLPRFKPDMATYAAYVAAGGEGMMVKNTTAKYTGKRSSGWLKVKVEMTEDVIVTGYKEGQGKYADTIGAILFGQYDVAGNLVERGACSGMDDATRYEIGNNRESFLGRVFEMKHFGYASDAEVDGFRHPNFVTFRIDKNPEDCIIAE